MSDIIRGTTPTIIYNFTTVDVTEIAVVYLTFKSNGSVIVRKDLSEATVGEASLTWLLTQEETLAFGPNQHATMMINYRLADGTRGASVKTDLTFRDNHISEVI